MSQSIGKWFNGLDETYQLTLPVIIGLCITIPMYLFGDLMNYNYLVIASLPMMGGALVSMIITFKGLHKEKVSIMPNKEVMIGVIIGSIPLIVFVYYVMVLMV